MTKDELKEIIKECYSEIMNENNDIVEESVDINSVNEDSIVMEEAEYTAYLYESIMNENCDFEAMISECVVVTEGVKDILNKLVEIINKIIEKIKKFFGKIKDFINGIIMKARWKRIERKLNKEFDTMAKEIGKALENIDWDSLDFSYNNSTFTEATETENQHAAEIIKKSLYKGCYVNVKDYIFPSKIIETFNMLEDLTKNIYNISAEDIDKKFRNDISKMLLSGFSLKNHQISEPITSSIVKEITDAINTEVDKQNKNKKFTDIKFEISVVGRNQQDNIEVDKKLVQRSTYMDISAISIRNAIQREESKKEEDQDKDFIKKARKLLEYYNICSSVVFGTTKYISAIIATQDHLLMVADTLSIKYTEE